MYRTPKSAISCDSSQSSQRVSTAHSCRPSTVFLGDPAEDIEPGRTGLAHRGEPIPERVPQVRQPAARVHQQDVTLAANVLGAKRRGQPLKLVQEDAAVASQRSSARPIPVDVRPLSALMGTTAPMKSAE